LALTAALVLRPGNHRQRNDQSEHHGHQCLHKGNSFSGHFCVTLFALYLRLASASAQNNSSGGGTDVTTFAVRVWTVNSIQSAIHVRRA
jgi:hypothetical protein